MPELRIIDDELWGEVEQRQKQVRHTLTHDDAGIRSERARRPVYLLSISDAARFCIDALKPLAPEIKASSVETAMKRVIAQKRTLTGINSCKK